MEFEKGSYLISRDELSEYCKAPMPRVRLFGRNKSGYEMRGDGFIRQAGGRFYVAPDWHPDSPCMLKPGDMIGIEIKGMIGFYPRVVDIDEI